MTTQIFRPKIEGEIVRQLHALALRENRSLTNTVEVALATGLRAMQNLHRPWAPSEPAKTGTE